MRCTGVTKQSTPFQTGFCCGRLGGCSRPLTPSGWNCAARPSACECLLSVPLILFRPLLPLVRVISWLPAWRGVRSLHHPRLPGQARQLCIPGTMGPLPAAQWQCLHCPSFSVACGIHLAASYAASRPVFPLVWDMSLFHVCSRCTILSFLSDFNCGFITESFQLSWEE